METLQDYIEKELKSLDRGIVATPDTREHLENYLLGYVQDYCLREIAFFGRIRF